LDVTTETGVRCATCAAPLLPGDRFCERCGTRASETDGDAPDEAPASARADRIELDREFAAAVSDVGLTHPRNDDAFELRTGGASRVAVVVCDGISSAAAGDLAARFAAAAAADVLAEALRSDADGRDAVLAAVRAAARAVSEVRSSGRGDRAVPACTLVAALCRDGAVVVGWLGDSRAYWITATETRQLTVDDSWVSEQIAAHGLAPAEALRHPRAHEITRWLGADAPDDPPQLVELDLETSGHLVLCTDGLWNYAAVPAELGRLVRALPAAASPAAIARSLADTALARGGHDNITVAVVELRPQRRTER
jgi:PPM family protein phosphatase